MERPTELGRVEFTHNERTFCYEFENLTIEQAELAREVGEWKYNQMQAGIEQLQKLFSSRGADYLSVIMSFLLREIKSDVVQPFVRDKVESVVEPFVKSLPVSQLDKLRECVADFFTNTGKQPVGSVILQGVRKKSAIEMLLPLIQTGLLSNSSGNDTLKN